jgi:hypothetical protein
MDFRSSMGVLTQRAAAYSSDRALACTSEASSFETAVPQVVLCEGESEGARERGAWKGAGRERARRRGKERSRAGEKREEASEQVQVACVSANPH